MPQMNMVQAINDALRLEMKRDPRVVLLGEDMWARSAGCSA
jgi:pyruvate dehydrogenase E1 component beta subunit